MSFAGGATHGLSGYDRVRAGRGQYDSPIPDRARSTARLATWRCISGRRVQRDFLPDGTLALAGLASAFMIMRCQETSE